MDTTKRLEELRTILRSETISYDELHELQDLGARGLIDPGDVELLEAAGIPEQYPPEDWKYEISNGDTKQGYRDWLESKLDEERNNLTR